MRNKELEKEDIKKVVKLADIDITQKEQDIYSQELSKVINYNMDHLGKINVEGIEPTAHTTGEVSVLREDQTGPGLRDEEAVKNSKEIHNKFFKVKNVFGE